MPWWPLPSLSGMREVLVPFRDDVLDPDLFPFFYLVRKAHLIVRQLLDDRDHVGKPVAIFFVEFADLESIILDQDVSAIDPGVIDIFSLSFASSILSLPWNSIRMIVGFSLTI